LWLLNFLLRFFFAAEPGVVSVADIAEPQVSVDIAANMIGGGREMLMPTSTLAIVGKGSTSTNAKSIVPKSNFSFCSVLYPNQFNLM
jgi:hypothetical protein